MPEARRRRRQKRIRIGLAGLAAISLTAASAGGAMGWMVGGTTSTIAEYKATPKTPIPRAGTGESVRPAAASIQTIEPAADEATGPTAYFPENNTVQWSTTVAPGQSLSAISVRNGDQKVNLIAHLAARGTAGGMIPVASMTVSPGREAVIRPPSGEYAMQIVTSPVNMPYDRIATLPRSAPAMFGLAPQDVKAVPAVRFEVSKGIIRRLPDPNAASADTRPDDADHDQYSWSGSTSTDNSSDGG